MAKLTVDSHIVAAFRNRTNTIDALSELIDNALDARATRVEIVFSKSHITVTDNGRGLKDLNVLWQLGGSKSKLHAENIGVYGIGAKEAALHFGSIVRIDSVHKGEYRADLINWDRIEREGTPIPHSGRTLPLGTVPPGIKDGGTIITISKLAQGRSRIMPASLIKRLSHRYRPGLRKEKSIAITFADGNRAALSSDADAIGAWKEREIVAFAADRPFIIRYTDLKEHDPNLFGLHIAYGDRFIEHVKLLAGKALPTIFYAEVVLSPKWKDCLSANKTSIVSFRDELDSIIHFKLKEWIKQVESYADEARIEHLNGLLHKHTAQIFSFSPNGSGHVRGKAHPATGGIGGDGGDGGGGRSAANHDANNDPNGDGERKPKKRKASGLQFRLDDTLGKIPFVIAPDQSQGQITILLNGSIPAIQTAYQVPYKIPVLWPLISAAFSSWVRDNIKKISDYLPGFFEKLAIAGYEIDPENALGTELFVYHWMMLQHPPSIKELEALSETA